MTRYILLIGLLLLASSKSFASFIYADDFAVGSDSTYLTDNATLRWLEGTGNVSSSSVLGSDRFGHNHFGGTTSATTYNVFPGILYEIGGFPNPQIYAALEIEFETGIRSFGLKVENATSSPFVLYLFGTDGSFLNTLLAGVTRTGSRTPDGSQIFDATHSWSFDVDVGKIKVGGASDGGYIYALDVTQVPEPSGLILLTIGLLCVVKVRRSVNDTAEKAIGS